MVAYRSVIRHHVFVKTSHKEIQLAEVGPRFEMKRQFFLPVSGSFHYFFADTPHCYLQRMRYDRER